MYSLELEGTRDECIWVLTTDQPMAECSDCKKSLSPSEGIYFCKRYEVVRCKPCDRKYDSRWCMRKGDTEHEHFNVRIEQM
jgi:hypothetical protein